MTSDRLGWRSAGATKERNEKKTGNIDKNEGRKEICQLVTRKKERKDNISKAVEHCCSLHPAHSESIRRIIGSIIVHDKMILRGKGC